MDQERDESKEAFDRAIAASLEDVNLQELEPGASGQDLLGELVVGTVVGVSGADVIVELGPRSQGAVPLDEFDEPPEVGSSIKVSVRGREGDLLTLSMRAARAIAAWDQMEEGSLVKARIIGLNRGGLEAKIGSITAFMPASQVDMKRVDELADYTGKTVICEVLEIDRDKKRVVISRRRVQEDEHARLREEGMASIAAGAVLHGKVTRLETFGAFVDVGHGVEGLVHVSNISYRRVERPDEVLRVGQEVDVQVLEVTEGGRRIGLGMKQLEADPWDDADTRFATDAVVEGTVRRLVDFGAFVEIAPGLEGLLHVSAMGHGRVRHAKDVLSQGEKVSVRVVKIDKSARRISLSRLDSRGVLLGSEDSAEGEVVDEVLRESEQKQVGTNLGDLFRKALKKDG
ncbi:MAG: S1 RNA-binding domain-containing protein [Planctomycetota bacterium]|nr:S1 RNA-binding domain-containing protein [Planctomycetota bacterium]